MSNKRGGLKRSSYRTTQLSGCVPAVIVNVRRLMIPHLDHSGIQEE
jgi:hypothetical protein